MVTKLTLSGKQALDTYIKTSGETVNVPGFVWGVANLEGEIYFQGAGNNIVNDPTSGSVTPDSVFWICSQTKMIVAVAALKLIDQGKITFDTIVADYIPEMKNPIIVENMSSLNTAFRHATKAVTVQHLMNFSSGLFYHSRTSTPLGLGEGYASKEMHQAADPISSFFQIIKEDLPAVPLQFEPGTDFAYGWSSDVLGFLVEKVSGQSLEQFWSIISSFGRYECTQGTDFKSQEHIFKPLGMRASFHLTPDLRQKLVNLAFLDEDRKLSPWANQVKIIEQDETKLRVYLGGVGIYTSMRDYLKLLRHILQLNAGIKVANPILKEESVRSIFIPSLSEQASESLSKYIMINGTQWSTALACTTGDWPERRKKGSAFWGGWAGTRGFMDPATGIAAVFGVQVVPRPRFDITESYGLLDQLEKLTYAGLR